MEKNYDIICVGMALVDSIIKGFDPTPISASGYRAVSGSLNVGGEAVNEAIAAARLGMRTGILCALGQDAAGGMVEAALAGAGVNTSLIVRSSGHATPVTTMFVNDDGTRQSITNLSHRHNFHPEQYGERYTDTRALILGSLFRAPFDDPEIILDRGIRNVIIKLGKNGCLFRNRSIRLRLPACEIDAVDATGAGDNFVAGFTSELLRGASPEEAIRFANA